MASTTLEPVEYDPFAGVPLMQNEPPAFAGSPFASFGTLSAGEGPSEAALPLDTSAALQGVGFPRGWSQEFGRKLPGVLSMLTSLPLGGAEAAIGLPGATLAAPFERGLLAEAPKVLANSNHALPLPEILPGGEETPRILAYHGSPSSFEKFDLSKVGTGEGAQAYGYGLYFAENEGVAKTYRDIGDAWANRTVAGEKYDLNNPLHVAAAKLDAVGGDRNKAYKILQNIVDANGADQWPVQAEAARLLKSGADIPPIRSGGSMYHVAINANPEHFLDWDVPLSEQSPKVQEIMRREGIPFEQDWGLGNTIGGKSPVDMRPTTGAQAAKMLERKYFLESAGGYDELDKLGPDDLKPHLDYAARKMASLGIPGIKYYDAGSRAAGSGTRNYVVFDDKTVNILRKYGLAGLGIGAGAAAIAGSDHPAKATTTFGLAPVEYDPFGAK